MPRGCRTVAAAWAAALAVVAGCSGGGDAGRDDSGRITSAGPLSVFELQPGDCLPLAEDVQAEIDRIDVLPCEDPHVLEVYAVIDFEDGNTYPGNDVLTTFADAACADQFADYVGIDYLESSLFFTYLLPTLRSWDQGDDRAVVCLASTTGEAITGSVRGSGR